MRRLTALVALALVFGPALTASATSGSTENYKDKFSSIGWGGSDGSLPWAGPWREINDDNDEKYGAVRVVSSGYCPSGNCMSIDTSLLHLGGNVGARRSADTSDLEEPELCFDLTIVPGLPVSSLSVQVNDGGGWETLYQHGLGEEVTDHLTLDISEFRSEAFQVRFVVNGILNTSQVFVDNVEIRGSIDEEPTSTTTTTTAPTTTTTTRPDGTTSSTSTTTTTRPHTTTTTEPKTETTAGGGAATTTTTTAREETTTTSSTTTTAPGDDDDSGSAVVIAASGDGGSGSGGTPAIGGIRQATRGLQASFEDGLFKTEDRANGLGAVDFDARFGLGAEVIRATWAWMILLATVIAWAIVSGMDRRRSQGAGEPSRS